MKNFNLIQLLPSLNSGGVEQGTIDVANFLADNQINNFVISNGGKLVDSLNENYVKHFKLSVNSKNFILMPFIAKKINKIMKFHNINILHIRSRAPAWLLPYINKNELNTVSTFHNVYGHQNIIKKIYNKGLAKTDHIVAISKYVKDEIIKNYKIEKKIIVINRGTDINFFNGKIFDKLNYENFLKKNKIILDKKIILYPGRLTEWKGQFEFLNIIESFKNYPYLFYFVGDTKNKSYTKKLNDQIKIKNLSNVCKILESFNKNDLKMMYYSSDLVISAPLKGEGFGRIVSEALSMKKIVFAYNFGGARDQLENLDKIYKINPLNQIHLRESIKSFLESPPEYINQLKEIGREHIVKNFSKSKMLEEYLSLYKGISF